MKCFIYRNLNRKGFVYSLKALEGPHKGRVVAYASAITVVDPTFVVSEKGRHRVLHEKRKNVHAGVVGDVIEINDHINRRPHTIKQGRFIRLTGGIAIMYNPYKYATFVTRVGEKPVLSALTAQFDHQRVEAFL